MEILGKRHAEWERDPHQALARVLRDGEKSIYDATYLSCAQYGIDGQRYSGYRRVRREDLFGRTYLIEFWDGKVALLFLDVLHVPHLHKNIPLENCDEYPLPRLQRR